MVHGPGASVAEELSALKQRIFELEAKAKGPAHKLSDDIEQYRRMEKCLRKHRKEWEIKNHITAEDMGIKGTPYLFEKDDVRVRTFGPWSYAWHTQYLDKPYKRPDPFDASHRCEGGYLDADKEAMDEFDHTIDYGCRRDRIRKSFEWEMDRLYLAEEIERRRRKRAAQRQKERDAANKAKEGNVADKPAKPTLNPVDWFTFAQLARVEESTACVIDVLVGEPAIDDNLGRSSRWFGYSGSRFRKTDKAPARKTAGIPAGQAPLPERIRIHSTVLLAILGKILETDNTVLGDGKAVVFIRPFKALVYCEPALKDWYAALERKFSKPATEMDKDPAAVSGDGKQMDAVPLASTEPEDSTQNAFRVFATNEQPSMSDSTAPRTDGNKRDGENDQEKQDEELEDDDPSDLTKSPTALEHLKCLLTFLDFDVADKRTYLNSSDCRKVFFSDLWHLFRPGLEVIGSDGKQAYRVVHVSSAKHRAVSIWDGWKGVYNDKRDKRNRDDSDNDDDDGDKAPFSIQCVYIDFNGKYLGPVLRTFDFKWFEGEREVTSFEVYPLGLRPLDQTDFSETEWRELEACPQSQRFRQKLIRRGAKFLDVVAVKHMYYAGQTLEVQEEVESQVVVDFETAFSADESKTHQRRPNLEALVVGNTKLGLGSDDGDCTGACCVDEVVYDDRHVDGRQRDDYFESQLQKPPAHDTPSVAMIPRLLEELRTGPDNAPVVSDDERVIMSYRVFGFVLRSRKWAQLDLSFLSDVHPSGMPGATTVEGEQLEEERDKGGAITAFDRLVLEKGHKEMIKSLITRHFRDKESKAGQCEKVDIVKGKGKGLILLLHGAPGVGKTSTAEGVAELFRKPLFQITCGDLGTTAREVEEKLETNFALANRWGCILLLDEADVLLAERTKDDFQRNGLVAVFLRVLEYYAGILFLTTNRVGDFDEAFTSRIHMSLYYPELSCDKTIQVFKINLELIEDRFARKNRRIEINKVEIGSFASRHFDDHPQARWNGRQIRNSCLTALALAEFEAQGNSHEDILNPDAVVKLTVDHFNTVRDAYLEFTKYMTDLYGSTAARRAKEGKLRAVWVDENGRPVRVGGRGFDKREAFRLDSQPGHIQEYGRFQQGFPQQQAPQQQQSFQHPQFQPPQGFQQYSQYRGSYGDSAQILKGQFPVSQPGHIPNAPGSAFLGAQPTPERPGQAAQGPPPPQQYQQPPNPAWFQGIGETYVASGQQGGGRSTPSS